MWDGVVQNPLILGYTSAQKSSACEGRTSGGWVSCSGDSQPPRVSLVVAEEAQAQEGEPMRMTLAGHQFPGALADALGMPAAHEAPMVQEELQEA